MKKTKDYDAIIYTDGSCLINPGGPGGFAAIVDFPKLNKRRQITGDSLSTTNNRMELSAALSGLECVHKVLRKSTTPRVRLVSDSQYLVKGLTTWMFGWSKSGFQTCKKNPDLWQRLWNLSRNLHLKAEHVYGHCGHPENEIVDHLAGMAANLAAKRKRAGEKHDERATDTEVDLDPGQSH